MFGTVGCLLIGGAAVSAFGTTPTWTPYFGAGVAVAADYTDSGYVTAGTAEPLAAQESMDDYLSISARAAYKAVTSVRKRVQEYTVEPGDSLWLIAQTYDTDLDTLLALNPDQKSTVLQPGQVLKVVPHFVGSVHLTELGETLAEISEAYDLSVDAIVAANDLPSANDVAVNTLLLLPGAKARPARLQLASRSASRRVNESASHSRSTAISLGWTWPIIGGLHSSEFGSRWGGFHSGMDIAVPVGTPAAVVADGTVTFAGWDGGYGYSVMIDHGGGVETRYAHASKVLVTEGQAVTQGDQVILVGSTGNSTGPHLHFEVLINGVAQNPREYLP